MADAQNSDESTTSVFGKRIRLTGERWMHIQSRHPNLDGWKTQVLETVRSPEFVVSGRHGELLTVRPYPHLEEARYLVTVYRETGEDGFIITAVLTSDVRNLKRRGVLWPKR